MFSKEKGIVRQPDAEELLRQAYRDLGRVWVSGEIDNTWCKDGNPDEVARRLRAVTPLPGFPGEEIPEAKQSSN